MVFNAYAAYYDLLYKEKDYQAEAEYIHRLIQQNCPGAKTILELGCGTGQHAIEFSRLGYQVVGVDLSAEMVARANGKNISNAHFECGDIRNVRLDAKYDVIVSLFHVMSYQTENKDLSDVFKTAQKHLNPNGVFIFDCWYGPGFLTDLPATRQKEIESANIHVHRTSTSQIDYHNNTVDVHFEVSVKHKESKEEDIIRETHKMRYLFIPELHFFAEPMKLVGVYDWLSEELTSPRYITVICKNDFGPK